MITIGLRFPASRYHATPQGRHVNEGVPEWPPSPYRLVRALYDVWRRKCRDISETEFEAVASALSGSPPVFRLPAAVASHTRSYLSANTLDPTDKSLVFDAFLALGREVTGYVIWPDLDLPPAQRMTLGTLLENLNYLGRSESWVSAELCDGPDAGLFEYAPAHMSSASGELTAVACVVPQDQYRGKKKWIDAITTSTSELIKSKASAPPLLRSIRYVSPEGGIERRPLAGTVRKSPDVRAVLLSLDGKVLPLAVSAIEVAEQIRVRLMGAHKWRQGGDETRVSALFSGKQNGGKRLDHGHVYILPQINTNGRIDRVLLVSRLRPFERDELDAVSGVQELWQSDGRPGVRVVVTWQGRWEPNEAVGLTAATQVESATPFVTVRHMRRGRELLKFLEDEVRRECRNHGMAEPRSVELAEMRGLFQPVEFRRNRKDDPPRPGYSFRLVFDEAVVTPFSLGYGSHFGLGQFVPRG